MTTISRTVRVSGKVQGVFFRASTKKTADELNIKGFVRNEPDGSVYIEAEGQETDIKKFLDWCQHGPPMARVSECETAEGVVSNFRDFMISR